MALFDFFRSEEAIREREARDFARAYAEGRLETEVVSAITFYMAETGVDREELARRLGVDVGRVTQILYGYGADRSTLTLRTLASIAAALGADVDVQLHPREES